MNGGGLLAAHDGDAGIRPLEQEARLTGAAAHAALFALKLPPISTVIFGTDAVATAVTSFAPFLAIPSVIFPADHETGDILQEKQRACAAGRQAR